MTFGSDHGGSDIGHGNEADICFASSHGDLLELFEPLKEILDQITSLIFFGIVAGRIQPFGFWRNYRFVAASVQLFAHPVSFISQESAKFQPLE